MEILSPAGHWEAMVAAVQSGAGAVYLGFGDYNARRGARNFSTEEFLAAVSYCHLRGVRVYVTINTLLTDRELEKAADMLLTVSRSGADGVILQDWGLLRLARSLTPDLPLHGSTQMTVHTLSGVQQLAELGIRCAVLSRELSREEVAHITENSPIAIEIFGHGALCMCYSGQCAMSALIGQRSGNRGKCAQPCRLPYQLDGGGSRHPLSLKDACLASRMPEVLDLGVSSLKIEGRMKRPEYVSIVTEIYSRLEREGRAATQEELRTLERAFSREGFTLGYWLDRRGPEMFGTRPAKAEEPKDLFAGARAAYEKENRRLVPASLHAQITPEAPARLTVSDGDGHTVTVTGDVPQAARTRSLTAEEAEARLRKTGGTAFTPAACTAEVADGLSLSAASLNALRRSGLEALAEIRVRPPLRREGPRLRVEGDRGPAAPPALTVSLMDPAQLTEELMACAPAVVSLPIHRMEEADLAPWRGGDIVFSLELPRVWRDRDEPRLRRWLEEGPDRGFSAVQVHNIGHLPLLEGIPLMPRGDYGLNIFNANALEFLRERGLASSTLSFELRLEQIRDMVKPLPCEAIVYGRLPLMITENCLVQNRWGCERRDGRGPCRREHLLRDRRGAAFPVCPVFGCRSEVENSQVLFLADKPDYLQLGLTWARLRFTTEAPGQCAAVLSRYAGRGDWQPETFTRGLFYRGVE